MNRQIGLFTGILIVLLGVLAWLTLSPLYSTPSDQAIRSRRTIPNTDVNPFGANFFLEREVEAWKRQETVRMARDAGIGWAKQQFIWAEIEPQRGQFSWKKYDDIVDLCAKFDIQVIARLDGAPNWSRQDNSMPGRPPDDFQDYGEFVYRFVEHYRGRIRYIQIWNEPNLYIEWGNRPVDPAGYVELLRIAYRRAKEADPNIYVLSAPLAITLGEPHPEPGKWRAMNDLQFLDEMYKAGAAPYFDILAANAFGMDLPPEDPPSPGKLNMARVLLQRQVMERYGDKNKAVWFNEYGWNAAPESFSTEALLWKRVSEKEQAEYTLRGIEYARQNWPWAGVFNIWYFRQVGHIDPQDAGYYFRMVDVNFVPRLVYLAVKDKAAQIHEAGPGYFEETHPAVQASADWTAQIVPLASGQAVLASDQAQASLTFTFYGGQVYLTAWGGPRAGQLIATVDGQNVEGLPLDRQGRSFIDLYAPEPTIETVRLISAVSSKRRTLRLTVSDEANPTSSGYQCVIDALEVRVVADRTWPVLPIVLTGIGCAVAGGLLVRAIRQAARR